MTEDELFKRIEDVEEYIKDCPCRGKTPTFMGSKLLNKLKEQGTQRGLLMLIGSVVPMLGLPTETMIQVVSAIFMIIGTHNVITEG